MTCPLIFRINLSGSRQMTFLSKDWIENSPVGLYWLNAKIDTDSDNIGSPLRLITSASVVLSRTISTWIIVYKKYTDNNKKTERCIIRRRGLHYKFKPLSLCRQKFFYIKRSTFSISLWDSCVFRKSASFFVVGISHLAGVTDHELPPFPKTLSYKKSSNCHFSWFLVCQPFLSFL